LNSFFLVLAFFSLEEKMGFIMEFAENFGILCEPYGFEIDGR
jgi:hypothetical protein